VPIKVFLVEDMLNLQGVIADLLKTLGDFKLAGTATTEAEANLWLDENSADWDLAIVDLVLEQGSGMGVVHKCRRKSRSPGAKIVVFSDYVTPGISRHCLRLGADAAISKADMPTFIRFCSGVAASAA
jgi:DNA-binding NarL/FixJ family response regulator